MTGPLRIGDVVRDLDGLVSLPIWSIVFTELPIYSAVAFKTDSDEWEASGTLHTLTSRELFVTVSYSWEIVRLGRSS
jgi:hypothetical protein